VLQAVAYLGFGKGGPWRARGARAYNGGLGAELPAASRVRAPGRGVRGAKPPKAETLFASECSMETANSPIFLKFRNAKDHQTLLNFAILAGKRQKNALFHIKSSVKNFHGRVQVHHDIIHPEVWWQAWNFVRLG